MGDGRSQELLNWLINSASREFLDHRWTMEELLNQGLTEDEVAAAIEARRDLPRELLPDEHEALRRVLAHAYFEGRDQLLGQLPVTKVVGYCSCGCATVDLAVDEGAPIWENWETPIPNGADVVSPDGELIGGVLVFVSDGKLSSLEVYSHGEPIRPFPTGEALRPTA